MSAGSRANADFSYNGLNYASWQSDEYQSIEAAAAMDDLAATNANWASVLVTWFQDNVSATAIRPDSQKTPTDAALAYAVQELHSRELKVMLKPHVDALDGSWRGQFKPSDANAWFANYGAFIAHCAQLAESLHAEGLIVGTEFAQISGAACQAQWHSIIATVRANFAGLLTYAANAAGAQDEFTRVAFWNKLDLLGLDVYFPLTGQPNPSLDQLISAWSNNKNGENIIQAIRAFSAAHTQPVIFTEIGYRSIAGCNTRPWDFQSVAPYGATEQANCYEAFFRAWNPHSSWMQGAFWWNWTIPAPSGADTDYTPRNKPAAQVLAGWYKSA